MFGPAVLAFVGIHACFSYVWGNGWTLLEMVGLGFIGVVGVGATVFGLARVDLIADEVGIRYRTLGYRRAFKWNEIEAIGVGNDRSFGGWDQPAARVLTGGAPKLPPTIGVNLKSNDRDAGTAAYQRGFDGYEVSFQNVFGRGVSGIVAELQARLDQSRRLEAVVPD